MKKMRIALASMLVAAGITATAGAANFTNCADRLKDVGLFQGTNQGYPVSYTHLSPFCTCPVHPYPCSKCHW